MKNLLLTIALTAYSTCLFALAPFTIGDDTTRIKTKNKTYLIIDNEEGDEFSFIEDTTDFEDDNDDYLEMVLSLDLGMSGYLTPSNSMSLPESQRMMELDSKSTALSFNFMLKGANIIKDRVYIMPGIGITSNDYLFKNNIQISTNSDTTAFTQDTVISFDKYELKVTYLQVPLILGFRLGNTSKKPIGIQIGAIGSYKINSKIKQKYYLAESDTKQKNVIKDDFNINPFKLDLVARVSIGNIGIFGKYSLTTLFEANKAPELYPFSVGFTLGGF